MSRALPALLGRDPASPFPDPATALREPDGLLAIGGDLEPRRLLAAYASGIFPWSSEGQPLLWWSPDPRTVFATDGVHLSSRFRRQLRGSDWSVVADQAFDAVVLACATAPRGGQHGTWITGPMRAAYSRLHLLGHAHSIEVHDGEGRLAGGMYGVALGRMFFGESMFSARSGGSKVALAALAHVLRGWGWPLLDAQVENPHLVAMGARAWPRSRFLAEVRRLTALPGRPGSWTAAFGQLPAATLGRPAEPTPMAAD
ncbi:MULTISPECIES: leucyl/phenylalanyl-tRNA--protein transferase [unclassified Luteimonas]|uniref:leucyl/phenylalanyl-tRNA--protein transferase n=1 Tax=unclassified Luteimonas TaxID=2629088 RepID=UPI0018F0D667|nr:MULTISPECIES: leucyl/phenylalanyl-tRNA--protein transferase [unclassified Luteimonas]MBJ6977835.1 leucyl/phenylalanyl-tRNA--protein transferase [Luteimonas sp. MC1895]MBJ6984654.1 leucyl/phenylalanyl-tRNA--protein transferase [Luteimonas sp. MC1750]QQO04744.1 leucyl/phenylalanyl-tRNA--protein transferase [Luteimonas sp. MC1750]